jgi:hypothetical protein
MAQRDRDRVATAHEDALDERLAAVGEASHDRSLPTPERGDGVRQDRRPTAIRGYGQVRTCRSSRRWNRSTWPAVSTIVCLPVKNGWQLLHTSTRSSGRVLPTVNVVPHEAQCTSAW